MIQIIITLKQPEEEPIISIAVVDTDGSATEKEVESAQQLTEALASSLGMENPKDLR